MNVIAGRLEAVREQMRAAGYQALVVPRADEYLGEYIPAHNERLRWLSGFTGSAGFVIVTLERAAIFVDGRYTVQVRREVSAELFDYLRLGDDPHADWLAGQLPRGAVVACDARMHGLRWYRDTASALTAAGLQLEPTKNNLVDACWQDRPAPRVAPALLLAEQYTGESSAAKRQRIGAAVAARGADAALVFAPDSVSWLLNIRGTDIPKLPVVQGMALLETDGRLTLLVDPGRIPEGFAAHVGEGVTVLPETEAAAVLAGYRGRRVLADPDTANAWSQLALEQGGATLQPGADPVLLPKAGKNAVEILGARNAHIRDAVAEIRFLAWLDAEVDAGRLHTENELADRLLAFRAGGDLFRDVSFDSISAAGGNAAMCHYNHLNVATPARLTMDSVYLIDSGGQYLDGTTDITRTVAIGDPGADIRRMFTLVLKGHIALDMARFPAGTTGSQLDILARQFLWQAGYDYEHGTGHGVGVFLSVHEGPQRIAKAPNTIALQPGMIVSNEPGYYRAGEFGIRCENLVVVRESVRDGGDLPMLEFDAITLVPFDLRLVEASLMTAAELAWLNDYHQRVAATIGPLLAEGGDREWLQRATRPLVA
ncbi:MAG: aminopeptidase P family protein [Gammaproteobacteria bacterium]|nr:aminopeptidase P family protein [Gammaproteobacteria bacterium]